MEQYINEDTSQLIAWLQNQTCPIEIHEIFDISVLNSLWTMLAGTRFSLSDERLRNLFTLLRESFHLLDMSGGLLNQMPFLHYIAPHFSGYYLVVHVIESINMFLQESINEHKNVLQPGVVSDFLDAFLHEVNKQSTRQQTSFTEKQLLTLLLDLFMAGSETTSNTLAFAIMFILKNPHVQDVAHKELDFNLEHGKPPSLNERSRLTYIDAIILETQRLGNVAPITPPHRAKRNSVIRGYTIPKDTSILISLYSMHMDSEYWGDPEIFRPDRFLDAHGKVIQHEYFAPFGLGRRRCLGEVLAKSSLFLFLASLLYYFNINLAPGEKLPTTNAIDGATLSPPKFKCVLEPRVAKKT